MPAGCRGRGTKLREFEFPEAEDKRVAGGLKPGALAAHRLCLSLSSEPTAEDRFGRTVHHRSSSWKVSVPSSASGW